MPQDLLFSSKEFKQLLGVSDCKLMHMRVSGELKFIKQGSAFLYKLHDKKLLLKHPLANQLFNWYQERHAINLDNSPKESESINSALLMIETVLLPINKKFGDINITYGFVSPELNKYIQRNSSSGTYPSIDQYAASELNNVDKRICKRYGLACDFTINGYDKTMSKVMKFIVNNLDFDEIYYYGESSPIHINVGKIAEKHLQIMSLSDKGRRIPGKKAFGITAKALAEEQKK